MCSGNAVHIFSVRAPEAISSPGIKSTMISGFQYCIEDIIELQNMSAKSPVTNINTGSWCIVYAVVSYRNISGNVNLYTCSLFFNSAYIVDEVIFRNTLLWIMIGLWTGYFIQFIIRYIILVPERRRTHGIGFSYKGYSAGAGSANMVTTDRVIFIIAT